MKTLITILLFTFALRGHASPVDHQSWSDLLGRHVVVVDHVASTRVDYAGFARDRELLRGYLAQLSAVDSSEFDNWPTHNRLAFLINAYNAWTVELILTRYPDLTSIRELGSLFRSPWKREFIPLFGKTVSLDEIEHGMIRADGVYEDPRIHFAVNCASIGCPSLRQQAYTGAMLQQQLEEQTISFLSDRSRNRFEEDRLEVSSIFDWYREDFERGWLGYRSLDSFLAAYASALGLTPEIEAALRRQEVPIEFLPYDWQLNTCQQPM